MADDGSGTKKDTPESDPPNGAESTELRTIPLNAENTTDAATDVEGKPAKLPYPRAIPFIISNEFCERFMYYGMRTVLVLYLTRKLAYDDDTATIMYHTFTTLVYFMCVFGAIISDSWLGKFNTILYLSIVYAIGSIVISLGAMPPLNLPGREITLLGLALVALGSGGIKPCVAAFGGDQFKMPEQAAQMSTFFSIFYFSINSGSLISTTITPILRSDVRCFGEDDCFSLAFGVPGMLMIVSIVIFVIGKFLYINRPPSGNMVVLVSKCIGNAISTRMKEKRTNPKKHWLDYSTEKYGKQLVNDTKILLKILVLYIPLPVFWALFDQQGSRWTFQATRMNGDLGGGAEVKPDQMQLVNPLLILLFIPLYDVLFYPLLSKIGIRRPLQKLALGGILGGFAFVISAIVELQLEHTYPILPREGLSQLRIYNTFPCNYTVKTDIPDFKEFQLDTLNVFQEEYISVEGNKSFTYTMTPTFASSDCTVLQGTFDLRSGAAIGYYGSANNVLTKFNDDPDKSRTGDPILRILVKSETLQDVFVRDESNDYNEKHNSNTSDVSRIELLSSYYEIQIGSRKIEGVRINQGSVGVLMVHDSGSQYFEVTMANSVHMFWLIPQYVVLTLGEVMYSVTGLQFSYAQAPESMKSVIQACWQLTVAFGNLIDVIVVSALKFDSQASEFFLFAGLMFVDMGLFILLAWRYKSVEQEEVEEAAPITNTDVQKQDKGLENVAFRKDE